MRDITLEDTFRFPFTTRAFATGIPTTLAGTPVLSVLEEDNATPITAGVSISVDRATVDGLNEGTIIATAANGYETGKSYGVYISTGTVSGVSVIGEVVHEFTIGLSAAFTRLGAPAGASVSADIADVPTVSEFNARTLISASYFDPAADAVANVTLVATVTTNTDMRGTDSAALASILGTPIDFGSGISTIAANLQDLADDGTAVYDRSTDSQQAIRDRGDAAWITGAGGTGLTPLAEGTAQGGSSSTIQLASAETFANSEPNGNIIKIISGTGAGQSRVIISYVGSTDTATVSPNWTTAPDATSIYEMVEGSANISAVSNVAEDIATATAVAAIPTTAMRGTDSAALASVATEARLAELDAANLPASVDAIPTTAMRGTDSAALASVATEARLAELDAANMPADIDAIPALITGLLTTQMTQSFAADGVAPTLAQALFMIQQILGDFSISGTTLTVREIDGATVAATYTLDSATTPTSLTRAT